MKERALLQPLALFSVNYHCSPDWRYPQYIVKPRVRCEGEGFFPHPRSCTWYYRWVQKAETRECCR